MESFAPNHARGPAFILEHGDPDGIDLAHSVWPSAAPDRRLDRFDHSSAEDRACSSRSFHARPASSNSDRAKVDAPSCWAPAIDCRQHGTEAECSRRLAGRKAWNNKAPLMAQIAYRLGRSLCEIVASTMTGRDIDAVDNQLQGPSITALPLWQGHRLSAPAEHPATSAKTMT